MVQTSWYSHAIVRNTLVVAIGLLMACQTKESNKLIIATAANAQYAINVICEDFTEKTGIETSIIISSSGKHTAQIEAGAPYDIFISADLKYPDILYRKGLTTSAPEIYAYGKLVLWTLSDTVEVSLARITHRRLNHIAMPNPKTAPYGRAAKEALEKYNLYDSVMGKLVFGSSVAQTNQFILANAADLGFTAASIVMAPAMKNKGHWQEIDKKDYSPIAQGAVIIKNSTHPEQAQKFYNYLYSDSAKEVLSKFGYAISNPLK